MNMINESVSFGHKLDSICRLCLKDEGPMSSIFTTANCSQNDNSDVLVGRITSIAQVQMSPNDGLPATICRMCRQQVDQFYDFRLLVEISDRTLRSCFDAAQDTSDFGNIVVQTADDDENAHFEELSENGCVNEKDLLPMNAILVPSTGGMQVWQICNMKEENREEDVGIIVDRSSPNYEMSDRSTSVCQDFGCPTKKDDSDLDDFEGVRRCLAESPTTTLAIEPTENQNDLNLGITATEGKESDDDQDAYSEREIHLLIDDDDDHEENHCTLEKYSCQLCLKSFQALDGLKSHVLDHFLAQKAPKSNATSSAESRRREIDASCSRAYDEDPEPDGTDNDDIGHPDSLIRQSCDPACDTIDDRIVRARKNLDAKRFKCKQCDKTFLKQSSRNYHEEMNHRPRREKSHKCHECGKEFVKRHELTYHKGIHTKSPPLCTICNKRFRNLQSFKMHYKRHTLGSRYTCSVCEKSYYTNSELARHAQQHTGLRGYPCELCDMSFLSKPELNRHVKYHTGVKKWECKICFKTYYESGHLKVHERVHTGERPFTCNVCEKGFITNSKLVRHLKTHARTREPDGEASSTTTNIVYTYH